MRRVPLSPHQHAAYAMGRTLIVLDEWDRAQGTPIELDRAILLDFAVEHPRALEGLVPDVVRVMRAHGVDQGDVTDLFAQRHLESRRERFTSVMTALLARELVAETPRDVGATSLLLAPTAKGRHAASSFTAPLSATIRALAAVFVGAWRRPKVDDLLHHIRSAMPNHALDIAHLATPFSADDTPVSSAHHG